MRLLQVIAAVAPTFGGPSTGSLAINGELNSQGHVAEIVATSMAAPNGSVESVREAHFRAAIPPRRVRLFRPSRPLVLFNSFGLVRYLPAAVRDCDGVHIHGIYSVPTIWAYYCCRRYSVPFGMQPHGNFEPFHRAKSTGRKRVFDALFTHRMVRDATYVLFASSSEQRAAIDVVPTRKGVVAPLGAALSPATVPRHPLRRLLDQHEGPVLLYLGRLSSKKRPLELVRALSLLQPDENAILVVAGPTGDVHPGEVRETAVEFGVEHRVLLWGAVEGGDKTWLFERADAYVLPSKNENFGVTVAEAMLAGCPVITTVDVASSEHLRRAQTGVVMPIFNAQLLAHAIRSCLNDHRRGSPGVLGGTRYAERHLTWEAAARAITAHLGATQHD